jgi:hypothetical protein
MQNMYKIYIYLVQNIYSMSGEYIDIIYYKKDSNSTNTQPILQKGLNFHQHTSYITKLGFSRHHSDGFFFDFWIWIFS